MSPALKKPLLFAALFIFLDQALKIWIKTTFALGESVDIASWFQLHFTENPGMAFGMEWGGEGGKYALSSFRILAIGGILWYMNRLAKGGATPFVLTAFGVVLAGALGNVVDSLFYGLLFDRGLTYSAEYSDWLIYSGVAQWGTGYAPPLLGNVVDMLYFPLWEGILPEWVPFWGGDYFIFFRPIFNLADACVTVGVVLLYWSSRNPSNWGQNR